MKSWRPRLLVVVAAALLLAPLIASCSGPDAAGPPSTMAGVAPPRTAPVAFARDLEAYTGLGAWMDVFDYAPGYQPDAAPPALGVDDLADMKRRGVKTVFLQATRWDDKSPEGIVDAKLIGSLLGEAHRLGLRVVGWYLPRFVDVDLDLARALQIRDFRAGDDRFDGLAIDIEYTEGEPDVAARSANLVRFSQSLRRQVTDMPVAGVILAPVHLEVVNLNFWPDFPYGDLRDLYDIWMPMVYWTLRIAPYADGYRFAKESVDRLRANLGQPAALVAPVGGISDAMTAAQITEFGQALVDMGAVGGSFYDWNTMAPEKQAQIHRLFIAGSAAALAPVPPWRYPPTTATTTTTSTTTSTTSTTSTTTTTPPG